VDQFINVKDVNAVNILRMKFVRQFARFSSMEHHSPICKMEVFSRTRSKSPLKNVGAVYIARCRSLYQKNLEQKWIVRRRSPRLMNKPHLVKMVTSPPMKCRTLSPSHAKCVQVDYHKLEIAERQWSKKASLCLMYVLLYSSSLITHI
jgi:hypothetical protein